MSTLVRSLELSVKSKQHLHTALTAPDGFALHAPGWVDAPVLDDRTRAQEPRRDLYLDGWPEAQGGFRVYRDWLSIINAYDATRGLPVYITSTNTFARPGSPPAQNYPSGWLTAALDEIEGNPQIHALCWFIDQDRSGSRNWDRFSLAERSGQMADAADEFDRLLAQ
jgi:hypothetical protein